MSLFWGNALRGIALTGLLLAVEPVHAEYLRIQLKVYGLDCELCARGVSATIQRIPGVKSVDISLKKGMLDIVLMRGDALKMSDLRKRIHENGFAQWKQPSQPSVHLTSPSLRSLAPVNHI